MDKTTTYKINQLAVVESVFSVVIRTAMPFLEPPAEAQLHKPEKLSPPPAAALPRALVGSALLLVPSPPGGPALASLILAHTPTLTCMSPGAEEGVQPWGAPLCPLHFARWLVPLSHRPFLSSFLVDPLERPATIPTLPGKVSGGRDPLRATASTLLGMV